VRALAGGGPGERLGRTRGRHLSTAGRLPSRVKPRRTPSFKIQIDAHGNRAWLYFECHDVGNFDLPDRSIAGDTFLAGTVGRLHGRWVFLEMTAGRAFPLSVDTYFFS